MARVTVEDCLKNVKNRFELVIIAAKRARQLMRGKTPKVDVDNDKATVVALREIAAGFTDFDSKHENEEDGPATFTMLTETTEVIITEEVSEEPSEEPPVQPEQPEQPEQSEEPPQQDTSSS